MGQTSQTPVFCCLSFRPDLGLSFQEHIHCDFWATARPSKEGQRLDLGGCPVKWVCRDVDHTPQVECQTITQIISRASAGESAT